VGRTLAKAAVTLTKDNVSKYDVRTGFCVDSKWAILLASSMQAAAWRIVDLDGGGVIIVTRDPSTAR
jgi:hypothetical protein